MLRRARWILVLLLLLLGGAALVGSARGLRVVAPTSGTAATIPVAAAPAVRARSASAAQVSGALPPPSPPQPTDPLSPPAPSPAFGPGYPVDLDRLRAETPRNSYWTDSAPTGDPDVLERREEMAAGWNRLYGKVLSGTANEPEIRSYFDHRRQVSEDAIELAGRMLVEHGSELPDRDRGLLELAVDMHRTRLAELPRQEAEARARKAEQDRRRAEWKGTPTP